MTTDAKITVAVCLFLALSAFGRKLGPERAAPPSENTIASKRIKKVTIRLTNDSGKLTARENRFCVLFCNLETASPFDVQGVNVDFRQQVGRIQEEQITAELTQDGVGRYCGRINLGRQYYVPATYYVVVRFVDTTGKKTKARFYLSVR
jgi:hypothetical protein